MHFPTFLICHIPLPSAFPYLFPNHVHPLPHCTLLPLPLPFHFRLPPLPSSFTPILCHPPSPPFLPHPLPSLHICLLPTPFQFHTPLLLCPSLPISLQLWHSWHSPPTSNTYPINLYFNPLLPATPLSILFPSSF